MSLMKSIPYPSFPRGHDPDKAEERLSSLEKAQLEVAVSVLNAINCQNSQSQPYLSVFDAPYPANAEYDKITGCYEPILHFDTEPSESNRTDIRTDDIVNVSINQSHKNTCPRMPLQDKCTNAPIQAPIISNSADSKPKETPLKENRPVRHAVRRKPVPRYSQLLSSLKPIIPVLRLSFNTKNKKNITPCPSPPTLESPTLDNRPLISLDDFHLKHILGAGAQGKVYLAKSASAGSPLIAIKMMNKNKLHGGEIEYVLQEQRILKRLQGHPFILELVASFHDSGFFYLATGYYGGGDLQKAIFTAKTFDIDRTRFYAAEMVSAIQYLHKNNIIHRDIKPANILLKGDGHIAIADFGLVKVFECSDFYQTGYKKNGMVTTSFCGTLCFMSPETLCGLPYGFEVDWWAFGVTVYAMLQGDLPWIDECYDDLRNSICSSPIPWSEDGIYPDAKSFVEGLLEKDLTKRLGVSGASAIFNHQFFNTTNWDDVEQRNIDPPYIPIDDGAIFAYARLRPDQMIAPSKHYTFDPHPEYNYINPEVRLPTPLERTAALERYLPPRQFIPSFASESTSIQKESICESRPFLSLSDVAQDTSDLEPPVTVEEVESDTDSILESFVITAPKFGRVCWPSLLSFHLSRPPRSDKLPPVENKAAIAAPDNTTACLSLSPASSCPSSPADDRSSGVASDDLSAGPWTTLALNDHDAKPQTDESPNQVEVKQDLPQPQPQVWTPTPKIMVWLLDLGRRIVRAIGTARSPRW